MTVRLHEAQQAVRRTKEYWIRGRHESPVCVSVIFYDDDFRASVSTIHATEKQLQKALERLFPCHEIKTTESFNGYWYANGRATSDGA